MSRSNIITSPLTGVIEEDQVVIDFGQYEGQSVFQINCDEPDYYGFLLHEKEKGNFFIKRAKNKEFKLYINESMAA